MDENTYLAVARQFLPLPTAPFHEHLVAEAVVAHVASRPWLEMARDPAGNLHLTYTPARSLRTPRLIATAHLDHPGLGFPSPLGRGAFFFERLGGVDPDQALGHQVRIHTLGRPAGQRSDQGRIRERLVERGVEGFVVETPSGFPLEPGCFATLDLPGLRRCGTLLWGRACDDLAGAVAGLCFLDELHRQRARTRAGLLLTRAEEVGFGGMLEAVHRGWLDPEAVYMNLECSSARSGATLGGGPIVRVGDRTTLFDPDLSAGVALVAAELAAADPGFYFQRKLMDGGTCEASALGGAGLHTVALALPLGNYHNKGKTGPAAEFIHLGDAVGLVRLLAHLALEAGGVAGAVRRAAKKIAAAMTAQRLRHRLRLRQTIKPNF